MIIERQDALPKTTGLKPGYRIADGRFAPGNAGGPGRPRGSRHKLAESLLEAVVRDFERHGAAAIERVRQEDPAAYFRVVAQLVPKEVGLTGVDGGPPMFRVISNVSKAPGDLADGLIA